MLLSDVDIKKGMENGSILISPFNESQLGNVSYDLTLGDSWFIYRNPPRSTGVSFKKLEFDHNDITKHFVYTKQQEISIAPQERILAHSREFAGGTGLPFDEHTAVTSFVQATSTAARIGLTACMCAGWGDVGYCNRWTLEIFNNSSYTIPIKAGSVIAQIIFETVTIPRQLYGKDCGSYQTTDKVAELEALWDPHTHMLPKKLKVLP